jgi:hypothetical protein
MEIFYFNVVEVLLLKNGNVGEMIVRYRPYISIRFIGVVCIHPWSRVLLGEVDSYSAG